MKQTILFLILILSTLDLYSETEDNKDKINELYKSAIESRDLKEYSNTKSILEEIIKLDEGELDAVLLLAEIEYLLNDWKSAIKTANEYLAKVDFDNKENLLDISWAYFLIGETKNATDYIIEFFKGNMKLLNENLYILIDGLIKKSFYHLVNNEYLMFYTIVYTIFNTGINSTVLFELFLNNISIIREIPFYYFKRKDLSQSNFQLETLKKLQKTLSIN